VTVPVSTPLPVGPLTPYCTPELLTQAPTGITWSSIPPGKDVSIGQKIAEQSNICARATGMVDDACHQPLRATTDTIILYGPGVRVGAMGNGPAVLIAKRWPVLEILSVQVARNCLPYVWVPVPADLYQPQNPVSGLYGSIAPTAAAEGGQGILISDQYVNWRYGRNGLAIQVQYVNGWPHCGLTSAVTLGATSLSVDDCTAWAITSPLTGYTGATGTVYDAGNQEVIQVTGASATSGPGTLTLAAPLQAAHAAGTMVSTMPANVGWAAIMFCVSQALARGATSTTVHQIPGGPGGKSAGPKEWADCAKAMLGDYARII
jgi:hypothetical protein